MASKSTVYHSKRDRLASLVIWLVWDSVSNSHCVYTGYYANLLYEQLLMCCWGDLSYWDLNWLLDWFGSGLNVHAMDYFSCISLLCMLRFQPVAGVLLSFSILSISFWSIVYEILKQKKFLLHSKKHCPISIARWLIIFLQCVELPRIVKLPFMILQNGRLDKRCPVLVFENFL